MPASFKFLKRENLYFSIKPLTNHKVNTLNEIDTNGFRPQTDTDWALVDRGPCFYLILLKSC